MMRRIHPVLENVRRWHEGKRPSLLKVEIWPTKRCNLACPFCNSWRDSPGQLRKGELSDDEFKRVIEECLDLGAQYFWFTGGGEPWLRGSLLLESMEMIKRAGRKGMLLTNGTLFTRKDIRRIVAMGWDTVNFSLDAPTAEVHDPLRGQAGAFRKCLAALRAFVREKKKKDRAVPCLGINMVLTNHNVHLVPDMIRFAARAGCGELLFQALMQLTEEALSLKLDNSTQQDFMRVARQDLQLAEGLGLRTNLREFSTTAIIEKSMEVHKILRADTSHRENMFESIPCYEPWQGLSIAPEGKVSVCTPLAERSGTVGDAVNCRRVWLGQEVESIRRMMLSSDISGLCKECCTNRVFENRYIRNHSPKGDRYQSMKWCDVKEGP